MAIHGQINLNMDILCASVCVCVCVCVWLCFILISNNPDLTILDKI